VKTIYSDFWDCLKLTWHFYDYIFTLRICRYSNFIIIWAI
jgi:hypothetical protein